MAKTKTRYELWFVPDPNGPEQYFMRDTYWKPVAEHWKSMFEPDEQRHIEIRTVEELVIS